MTAYFYQTSLPAVPPFVGKLEQNYKLQEAVYFAKGKLVGPETILFIDDILYTGLVNGQLVKLDNEGNIDEVITQSGDENVAECRMLKLSLSSSFQLFFFEDKISKSTKDCGLILGMRYKKGFIYMVDAYNGLLKVDLKTSKKHI